MSCLLRKAIVALCAVFALAVIAPSTAFADNLEEAQANYEEGMESYFAGEYSEAILSFKKAYELDPNPIFLFNMSIAYEKAGNFDEAYREGLTAQLSGELPEQAAQINGARVPALAVVLRSREVSGRMAGTLACENDTDCRSGLSCDAATNMCIEPKATDGGDKVASGGPFLGIPFSIYGWIGSGLAVVGLGMTATAVIIDLGVGSDIEEYDALSEVEKRSVAGNSIADDIESSQSTGQILLYSGGAFLAAGAGLIVYDLFFNDGNEHRTTSIDVGVSPGGAQVKATYRF